LSGDQREEDDKKKKRIKREGVETGGNLKMKKPRQTKGTPK
jgi:hypothetical protein